MPLPMPEEEEKFRCPHGERNQALMPSGYSGVAIFSME